MFLRNLLILSLLLCGGIWAWNQYMPEKFHSPHAYFIVLYFFVLTYAIRGQSVKANERSPKDFVRFFMGSTALRLLLHVMVILIYGLINRDGAAVFIMAFLVIYMVFLVFEVSSLLRFFSRQNKS
ncbi:MAG TPA: hypothetical protein VI112_16505 [Bacteroidia bacterium]|jgi:hypothetical protein